MTEGLTKEILDEWEDEASVDGNVWTGKEMIPIIAEIRRLQSELKKAEELANQQNCQHQFIGTDNKWKRICSKCNLESWAQA